MVVLTSAAIGFVAGYLLSRHKIHLAVVIPIGLIATLFMLANAATQFDLSDSVGLLLVPAAIGAFFWAGRVLRRQAEAAS